MPIGLISVMPQAWITSTPKSSSNARSTLSGIAEPPMATLRAGHLRLMLAQVPLTMARRGRGVHFFLTVEDVDEFYDFVRAGGIQLNPPADEGWGGRFVTLEDPDHYRLFFVTWHDEGARPGAGAPGLLN